MANSSDEIVLTGNATQLLAEYQKVNKALLEQAAALKQTGKEASDADRQEQQWARNAKRDAEQMLGPRQRYNAEVARLDQLLSKNKITQDEYNRALEKQQRLLRESDRAAGDAASSMIGFGKEAFVAITGVGGAMAGVLKACSLLKSEWEIMRARQREALSANVTFGQAVRGLAQNFDADASLGLPDLEHQLKLIGARTSTSPALVAQAAATAMSAKGPLSNMDALSAVEAAFRFAPGDASAASELSGRALDLMVASGERDPRAVLGLLVQAGQAARTTNLGQLGKSAVPAISSAMAAGDSMEGATELFSTFTKLLADQEGSKSSTAAINFSSRAALWQPKGKNLPADQLAAYRAAGNSWDRIAVLQRSPELRAAFLDEVSFDSASAMPVRQLLESNPETMAAVQSVRDTISSTATGAQAFEAKVSNIGALDSQRLLGEEQKRIVQDELLQLNDQVGARHASAAENFRSATEKMNLPGFDELSRPALEAGVGLQQWASGGDEFDARAAVLAGLRDQMAASSDPTQNNPSVLQRLDQGIQSMRDLQAETNRLLQQQKQFGDVLKVQVVNQPVGPPPENALGRQ